MHPRWPRHLLAPDCSLIGRKPDCCVRTGRGRSLQTTELQVCTSKEFPYQYSYLTDPRPVPPTRLSEEKVLGRTVAELALAPRNQSLRCTVSAVPRCRTCLGRRRRGPTSSSRYPNHSRCNVPQKEMPRIRRLLSLRASSASWRLRSRCCRILRGTSTVPGPRCHFPRWCPG